MLRIGGQLANFSVPENDVYPGMTPACCQILYFHPCVNPRVMCAMRRRTKGVLRVAYMGPDFVMAELLFDSLIEIYCPTSVGVFHNFPRQGVMVLYKRGVLGFFFSPDPVFNGFATDEANGY